MAPQTEEIRSPSKIVGRESVIEYMLSMLPGFDDVKLERHMIGGDYVATLWEAQTVWGNVPISSVFRIADEASGTRGPSHRHSGEKRVGPTWP